MSFTERWTSAAISHRPLRTGRSFSDSPKSTVSKNWCETDVSASSGHRSNQSVVQQLISEGNMRQRTRKAEPTGDIASTMCRFSRTRAMKTDLMLSFVSGRPASRQKGRHVPMIFSHSSEAKRFGTSPELRMLLTSSTNASITICVARRGGGESA